MKHIVIVGGGFAGVSIASQIAAKHLPEVKITLITPQTYFTYYPGLFHLLTGFSVQQLAVPYDFIFKDTDVLVEKATVTRVDVDKKQVETGPDCLIAYDYLVLVPGSVVNYFDMADVASHLHTVTTVDDTLELRRSIHELLTRCHFDHSGSSCGGHITVIGGGPNGVESAAEIALLVKQIASSYQIDPAKVTTELIVSGDRVTPMFDPDVSRVLHDKLISLGVKVTYNKRITKDEMIQSEIPLITTQNKLIIWSTGMKLAPLAETLTMFVHDKRGKVEVDEYLHAKKVDGTICSDVFVGGDLAATQYSGLAQTAQADARCIATNIAQSIIGGSLKAYKTINLGYVIAMGRDWAIWTKGAHKFFGLPIWYLRRLIDFKSYIQFLPLTKALKLFMSEHETWEEFDEVARKRMEEKYAAKSPAP